MILNGKVEELRLFLRFFVVVVERRKEPWEFFVLFLYATKYSLKKVSCKLSDFCTVQGKILSTKVCTYTYALYTLRI